LHARDPQSVLPLEDRALALAAATARRGGVAGRDSVADRTGEGADLGDDRASVGGGTASLGLHRKPTPSGAAPPAVTAVRGLSRGGILRDVQAVFAGEET